ncbi:MAG: hypothetical protein EBT86_12610 [Actinobacteria bacterium]|nr:hypothetical protein [Actinomycetota bacterium]
MSIIDTMTHLIDHLETGVNWNKVFGIVDSLYSDKGFSSNADNFARATAVEKGLAKFSDLVRVDKTGYDFIWEDETENFIRIEMKMGKGLFYKRKDVHATKKFKVKSFLSETKTVEDFKKDSTYDYLLVLDLTARRVVVLEDEVARSLYQEGADGAMIELKLGDYYQCDIGEVNPILPPTSLSQNIDEAIENYLDF